MSVGGVGVSGRHTGIEGMLETRETSVANQQSHR